MAKAKQKGESGGAPAEFVAFEEGSEVEGQLDQKTQLDIIRADQFIDRISMRVMAQSMGAVQSAFEAFRDSAAEKKEQEGSIEWVDLVGDLVEVATGAMFEHVKLIGAVFKEAIGVALKHAAIGSLNAMAPEKRSVSGIAQHMITELAIQQVQGNDKLSAFTDAHRGEFRNAYLSAEGDANKKQAACEKAMATEGIEMPAPNAGRLVFTSIVERFNIDRWVEGCKTGKDAKTADCATDAAIPGIKKDAEQEGKERFHEQDDDGKQKGKAVPIGSSRG
jgi:hypothetical protein